MKMRHPPGIRETLFERSVWYPRLAVNTHPHVYIHSALGVGRDNTSFRESFII